MSNRKGTQDASITDESIAGRGAVGALSVLLIAGVVGGVPAVCGRCLLADQPGWMPIKLAIDPEHPQITEAYSAMMQDYQERYEQYASYDGMSEGRGYLGAVYGPTFLYADVEELMAVAGLAAEQRDAVKVVYRQRLATYAEVGARFERMAIEGYRRQISRRFSEETDEQNKWNERVMAVGKEVQAQRTAMRRGVLEDVRAVMTKAQEARWPAVERVARRIRFMRLGPVAVAPHLHVEPRQLTDATLKASEYTVPETIREAIAGFLDSYDLAFDAVAVRAIRCDDEMNALVEQDPKATSDYSGAFWQLYKKSALEVDSLREANDAVIRQVAGVLDPREAASLRDRYDRARFPEIYKVTHGERVLEVALTIGDLDPMQRESLQASQSAHLEKLKALRAKLLWQQLAQLQEQARRSKEPEEREPADEEEARRRAERSAELYTETHRTEMKEADLAVVKRVRTLLNESQRARLPKRPWLELPLQFQPLPEEDW